MASAAAALSSESEVPRGASCNTPATAPSLPESAPGAVPVATWGAGRSIVVGVVGWRCERRFGWQRVCERRRWVVTVTAEAHKQVVIRAA